MRSVCLIGFAFFVSFASSAFAQLSVSLNEDSYFVLSGKEPELLGVQFESPNGVLIPVPDDDAGPFQFLLSNGATQVTFGALEPSVDLDGELVFPAGIDTARENDVRVRFGTEYDSGIIYPTGPATWGDVTQLQQIVDGVRIELSHPDSGSHASNAGLAPNQFLVNFHSVQPSDDESPRIFTGIHDVFVGSWELVEDFSFDGETAVIDFEGEQTEFYNDGTYVLPEGSSASRLVSSVEFTIGDAASTIATPEPASFQTLVLASILVPCLFRGRRRTRLAR